MFGRAHFEKQLHDYVLCVAAPLWIGAGLLDWLWHKKTKIESTSGPRESVLHLMMLTEAAPVALAPLLFEVNAGSVLLMLGAFAAHEATGAWDVSMTAPRRVIEPAEQHIHSVLEMMPFCVTSLYVAAHWDRLTRMLRHPGRARFRLRLKQSRPSVRAIAGLVSAIAVLDFAPHIEELLRCWRAQRKGITGRDTPDCARVLYGERARSAV